MVLSTRVSLAEYLAMPETKPYAEYVRGEVVPKPVPNDFHSAIVKELLYLLESFVRGRRFARVETELRFLSRSEDRIYIPDVAVRLLADMPRRRENPVETPPALAIEVLSPDDRPGDLLDKVSFYMRIGVQLAWVVDPERRSVTVFRAGHGPQTFTQPATIGGDAVLEGFELSLAELFAVLDEIEAGDEAAQA